MLPAAHWASSGALLARKADGFIAIVIVALALFYSLWTGFLQKQDSLWLAHTLRKHPTGREKTTTFVYTNDSLAGKDFTLGQYQRYFGLKDKVILPLKNSYQRGGNNSL